MMSSIHGSILLALPERSAHDRFQGTTLLVDELVALNSVRARSASYARRSRDLQARWGNNAREGARCE